MDIKDFIEYVKTLDVYKSAKIMRVLEKYIPELDFPQYRVFIYDNSYICFGTRINSFWVKCPACRSTELLGKAVWDSDIEKCEIITPKGLLFTELEENKRRYYNRNSVGVAFY